MTKVLIVDDSKSKRGNILSALQEVGIKSQDDIIMASSLSEAMQIIDNPDNRFDIAIVDRSLVPDDPYNTDGLEVIKAVRTKHPNACIINLSAIKDTEAAHVEALEAGANYFIGIYWYGINYMELLTRNLKAHHTLVAKQQATGSPDPRLDGFKLGETPNLP